MQIPIKASSRGRRERLPYQRSHAWLNQPMSLPTSSIHLATDHATILRCHAVIQELRPHLADAGVFAAQVMRQQAHGYRLAFLEAEGAVRSVVGYRLLEKLSAGRFLYVDDLATREADHGKGFGGQLFDWVAGQAREAGCSMLQLDSGVHRHRAHRFYLDKGMHITCHHFDLRL